MKALFFQIEFRTKDGDQAVLLSKDKKIISPVSLEIINYTLSDKNLLLFSQGGLNFSSLISACYSIKNDKDVAIFLPEKGFEKQYRKYTHDFFSLLYRKHHTPLHSTFFYKDILWSKGQINDFKELINFQIEAKPIHGDYDFRKSYRDLMINNFNNDLISTTKEIVLIPYTKSIPLDTFGKKDIWFENKKSTLEFRPKLFILESVNEIYHNFEKILSLIRQLEEKDHQYLIHFSWPYQRGLKLFLESLKKEQDSPKIVHLGKRLCHELAKSFFKPDNIGLNLSLENSLWDRQYYNQSIVDNIEIILPSSFLFENSKKYFTESNLNDERLKEIRSYLRERSVGPYIDSLLKFPPSIDSIVLPSDIKDFDIFSKKHLPLYDIIDSKLDDNHYFLNSLFRSINEDLEESRDLAYMLRGLPTHEHITKFTLLQSLILSLMNETNSNNSEDMIKIIISNLYPGLSSSPGLRKNFEYLFRSLRYLLYSIDIPTYRQNTNCGELVLGNNRYILWHEGNIIPTNEDSIKRHYKNCKIPIDVRINRTNNFIAIDFYFDVNAEYIKTKCSDSELLELKRCNGLAFYTLVVFRNGQYSSKRLRAISYESTFAKSVFSFFINWICEDSANIRALNQIIEVKYIDLHKIRHLPNTEVIDSILLMPGPIPFVSYSNSNLYLPEGFDILFMPFKKIVFLCYPGLNYKNVRYQIEIYQQLLSKDSSPAARNDLSFSIKYSDFRSVSIPSTFDQDLSNENKSWPKELDESILAEMVDSHSAQYKDEENDMLQVKNMLKSLKLNKTVYYSDLSKSPEEEEEEIKREHIHFIIKFPNGETGKVLFRRDKLLRKLSVDAFSVIPAFMLKEGDEIAYVDLSIKESIDDYVLNIIFGKEGLLEQVFEPFICIKLLLESIQSFFSKNISKKDSFERLYWMTANQRTVLYNIFMALQQQDKSKIEQLFQIEEKSNIWKSFITADHLVKIYSRSKDPHNLIYMLLRNMGFTLKESTFESYFALNEDYDHYFFRDINNLNAIGKLIGSKEIMSNHIKLNDLGEKIAIILRMIGNSISKSISGQLDPTNEIDSLIESSIVICKIIRIDN